MDGATYITASAWVNFSSLEDEDIIIAKIDAFVLGTGGSGYGDGDDVAMWVDIGAVNYVYSNNNILADDLDEWHHMTVVFDGTLDNDNKLKFYYDGVLQSLVVEGTISATTGSNGNSLIIGSTAGGTSPSVYMDEVRIYDRALSASEVTELYNQGAKRLLKVNMPQTDLVPSGLAGYWTFDGQDTDWGANTVSDMSGNSNTGTITNMSTTTSPTVGVVGQAFSFDGVDDYIPLPITPTILDNATAFSISSWVKVPSYTAVNTIFYRCDGDILDVSPIFYIQADGTLQTYINTDTGPNWDGNVTSASSVNINEWTHVAVTWDANGGSGNVYLYINGKQEDTDATTGDTLKYQNYDSEIGRQIAIGTSYFIGEIDELRIYDRALSASEVGELYKAGAGR
jgi:hypothetical protein